MIHKGDLVGRVSNAPREVVPDHADAIDLFATLSDDSVLSIVGDDGRPLEIPTFAGEPHFYRKWYSCG